MEITPCRSKALESSSPLLKHYPIGNAPTPHRGMWEHRSGPTFPGWHSPEPRRVCGAMPLALPWSPWKRWGTMNRFPTRRRRPCTHKRRSSDTRHERRLINPQEHDHGTRSTKSEGTARPERAHEPSRGLLGVMQANVSRHDTYAPVPGSASVARAHIDRHTACSRVSAVATTHAALHHLLAVRFRAVVLQTLVSISSYCFHMQHATELSIFPSPAR
jgi:hypothetical protein